MNTDTEQKLLPFGEFVTLMAVMTSLVALSIDAMLPALAEVGKDLLVSNPNDNQLIITMLFFGMALGQIFYGPLSDSIGRKPAIIIGFVIFLLGCLLSTFASDFQFMLLGRILQGVGLAAPRIVTMALIRDLYDGNAMAKVMSLIMAVFILVPMIAPALGQGILLVFNWRAIFAAILLLGVIVLCWFMIRQPETLLPKKRIPFSFIRVGTAIREILSNPTALGYTVVAGFISSAFIAFLSSVQQILQQQYALGHLFPLYFAGLAFTIGIAYFLNGKLVMHYGMQRLSKWALLIFCVVTASFLVYITLSAKQPSLALLLVYFSFILFSIGILNGNLSALAMQPLGHIAGIGASVIGSLTLFISVPLSIVIGQAYNGTVLPLIIGFFACGGLSLFIMLWTESHTA